MSNPSTAQLSTSARKKVNDLIPGTLTAKDVSSSECIEQSDCVTSESDWKSGADSRSEDAQAYNKFTPFESSPVRRVRRDEAVAASFPDRDSALLSAPPLHLPLSNLTGSDDILPASKPVASINSTVTSPKLRRGQQRDILPVRYFKSPIDKDKSRQRNTDGLVATTEIPNIPASSGDKSPIALALEAYRSRAGKPRTSPFNLVTDLLRNADIKTNNTSQPLVLASSPKAQSNLSSSSVSSSPRKLRVIAASLRYCISSNTVL